MLNRTRVEQLLEKFSGKRIIVLGDVMLDAFVWGRVRRISPEAPVPVVEVTDETYRLGGAANVAANIHSLGGTSIPIGVVGQDAAANHILELMQQLEMDATGIVQDDRPTTVKTRIVAHNQQVARTDREVCTAVGEDGCRHLAAAFDRALGQAQAIVVSDYDKGVVNPALLALVLPKARNAGVPVFIDPKVHHAEHYHPITAITPNHREAELLTGMPIHNVGTLQEAGGRLLQKFACEYALITRGEEGMSLFSATGSQNFPSLAREVFDVTGAGDTVIATLALARAGGATIEEAAILANHAAGIVVGKIGTATVSREELMRDFDERNAHSAG